MVIHVCVDVVTCFCIYVLYANDCVVLSIYCSILKLCGYMCLNCMVPNLLLYGDCAKHMYGYESSSGIIVGMQWIHCQANVIGCRSVRHIFL